MDLFEKCDKFTGRQRTDVHGRHPCLSLEDTEGTEVTISAKKLVNDRLQQLPRADTPPHVRPRQPIDATREIRDEPVPASRLRTGTLANHLELEKRLADYVEKEAALVVQHRLPDNVGTISALVAGAKYVVTDQGRSCQYRRRLPPVVRHDETLPPQRHGDLEKVAEPDPTGDRQAGGGGRGVQYGGRHCPPAGTSIPLCKKYNARLMVDDAHSLGGAGRQGHGDPPGGETRRGPGEWAF